MSRPASGSVTRDGDRWRARVTLAGRRINLGTHATEEAAWEAVEAALQQALAGHVAVGGEPTLRTLGASWLDQRDLGGIVDSKGERRRWRGRVLSYPVADIPLRALTQADVEAWLARVAAATSRWLDARPTPNAWPWSSPSRCSPSPPPASARREGGQIDASCV